MAASSKVGGYQCEFLGTVSEDFVCKHCKHVAREPHITTCCSETFCQQCITSIIEDKKPCQSCKTAGFFTTLNIKYQRRILALEVCCTVKDRGCEWSGKLEGLEAHLDEDTGDCEYVDVKCPNRCDQVVEKRNLPSHLTDSCLKREFACQHCNFKATYEVVSNDHWPQCSFYPVPCPNACGIQAIERGDLEAHLLQCPLEEVKCDFVHAGCDVELVRKDLEKHMEESTQKHMALVPALTLRTEQRHDQLQRELENEQHKIEAIEEQLQKQHEQLQKQQEQLQKKTQENEVKINYLQQQLQQKAKKAEELGDVVEMPNFEHYKDQQEMWYSSPRHTHPGGYRFGIAVRADDCTEQNRMAVYFYSATGRFDRLLKWGVNCTITLELLNQERDQDHITVTTTFPLYQTNADKGYVIVSIPYGRQHIIYADPGTYTCVLNPLHKDLLHNAQKQTCYLKNDCLQFRVTKVKM